MGRRVMDIRRHGQVLMISLQTQDKEFGRLAEFCNGSFGTVHIEPSEGPSLEVQMMEVDVDGSPRSLRILVYLTRTVEFAPGHEQRISLREGALEALAQCLGIPAESLTRHTRIAAPDSA